MAPESFVPPKLNAPLFHCPHCGVYAHHFWEEIYRKRITGASALVGWRSASCAHCKEFSLWRTDLMVYPASAVAPVLDASLPKDTQADHDKAYGMLAHSVRKAAAFFQRLRKRS